MKRIGIYFFCVIAIGCVTSSILYWENEKSGEIKVEKAFDGNSKQREQEETELSAQVFENIEAVSKKEEAEKRFLVKDEDGYLVIYDQFTEKRYDETTILVNELPEHIRKQLIEGLFFMDEQELYEFLENYSS